MNLRSDHFIDPSRDRQRGKGKGERGSILAWMRNEQPAGIIGRLW